MDINKILKGFILQICVLLPLAVMAGEKEESRFNFGVETGLEISNPTELTRTVGYGFKAGMVGEYDFTTRTQGWFLGAGIGLVSKPWKTKTYEIYDEYGSSAGMYKMNNTPYYLNIPIVGGYRFEISSDFSLGLQTGIYMSTGIFGKGHDTLYMETPDGEERVYKNSFNCFDNVYDRLDWGWTVGVHLRCFENWQLNVSYSYQFNSFLKGSYDARNQSVGIGIAYMF